MLRGLPGPQRRSAPGVGDHYAVEFVGAGRDDRGALIDLGGVEQVKHGDVLHGQDLVHAFQAEAALAIEEVGDMGLLEAGLLGEVKAGEIAFVNALPEGFAEVVLKSTEFQSDLFRRMEATCTKLG